MRILIIHDREDVAEEARVVCQSAAPDAIIHIADDYISARRHMTAGSYDFALVDLTLPHRRGQTPSTYEVAANLLTEIFDLDDIDSPGDILGITFDPEALKLIDIDVGKHLMGVLDQRSNTDWKQLLANRIAYIQRSRAARSRAISTHHDFDVCVITALDKERDPFRALLELQDAGTFPKAQIFTFEDSLGQVRKGVIRSVGRAGQPRASSIAQAMLNVFRPKYMIMSGICGGVKGKAKIGDTVIFESVIDWDYGKWRKSKGGPSQFFSRPDPVSIRDTKAHDELREFISAGGDRIKAVYAAANAAHAIIKPTHDIHMMPAASGSAVIGSEEIIARIGNLNDSVGAVDMESYAIYAAAATTNVVKPEVFCIKTVSDYCDGSKNDKYHSGCCEVSARFAVELIKNWLSY